MSGMLGRLDTSPRSAARRGLIALTAAAATELAIVAVARAADWPAGAFYTISALALAILVAVAVPMIEPPRAPKAPPPPPPPPAVVDARRAAAAGRADVVGVGKRRASVSTPAPPGAAESETEYEGTVSSLRELALLDALDEALTLAHERAEVVFEHAERRRPWLPLPGRRRRDPIADSAIFNAAVVAVAAQGVSCAIADVTIEVLADELGISAQRARELRRRASGLLAERQASAEQPTRDG